MHAALMNNNGTASAAVPNVPPGGVNTTSPAVEVKLEEDMPPLQPLHHHQSPCVNSGMPVSNTGWIMPGMGGNSMQTGAMPQPANQTAAMQAMLLQQQQQILGNMTTGLQTWPGWPQHPQMMQQQQQQHQQMMQQVRACIGRDDIDGKSSNEQKTMPMRTLLPCVSWWYHRNLILHYIFVPLT